MRITATRSEGVFKPTGEVKGAVPGKAARVFPDEELLGLTEGVQWLRAAEPTFEFWKNDDDAIYDQPWLGDVVLVSFPFTDLTVRTGGRRA
jgi:hypothetical protein